VRGCRAARQPSVRLAPHPDGMNILPGRAQPSQTLPPGGGLGKPGFLRPLHKGCALTFPRVGAWGNPVPPWSRETVMRMTHHAAMTMTWERGRPARMASPRAR